MERIDKSKGTTARDVEAMKLIKAYAEYLKKKGTVSLPKLHDIMRTRVFSEYSPYDPDWYFIRCGRNRYFSLKSSRHCSPPLHST